MPAPFVHLCCRVAPETDRAVVQQLNKMLPEEFDPSTVAEKPTNAVGNVTGNVIVLAPLDGVAVPH